MDWMRPDPGPKQTGYNERDVFLHGSLQIRFLAGKSDFIIRPFFSVLFSCFGNGQRSEIQSRLSAQRNPFSLNDVLSRNFPDETRDPGIPKTRIFSSNN